MYALLNKRGQLIAFLVGAVVVLLHIFTGMKGNYDLGLWAGILLTIVAFVVMLIGIAKYFAQNPRQIKVLLGFIGILAFVAVVIMLSSGNAPAALQDTIQRHGITPGIYKYINGSVNATLILLGLSFVGLIVSEIVSMFK